MSQQLETAVAQHVAAAQKELASPTPSTATGIDHSARFSIRLLRIPLMSWTTSSDSSGRPKCIAITSRCSSIGVWPSWVAPTGFWNRRYRLEREAPGDDDEALHLLRPPPGQDGEAWLSLVAAPFARPVVVGLSGRRGEQVRPVAAHHLQRPVDLVLKVVDPSCAGVAPPHQTRDAVPAGPDDPAVRGSPPSDGRVSRRCVTPLGDHRTWNHWGCAWRAGCRTAFRRNTTISAPASR